MSMIGQKPVWSLPGEQSWLAGLERLLLGYAMPGRMGGLFVGILPYDNMEGERPAVLGRLVASCQSAPYNQHRSHLNSARLPHWSELLQSLLESLFAPGEDESREAVSISRVLNELGALQTETAFTAAIELPWSVPGCWASLPTRSTGRLSHRWGNLLRHAADAQHPLQSNRPDRHERRCFPAAELPLGFDLISRSPRRGDRSLRIEDRYLFLEAVISARQRLYISFTGQRIQG